MHSYSQMIKHKAKVNIIQFTLNVEVYNLCNISYFFLFVIFLCSFQFDLTQPIFTIFSNIFLFLYLQQN